LAAVYGPLEAPSRKENAERAVVEVLFRRPHGLAGAPEREFEYVIRRTVEAAASVSLHPRTVVQVVLQVVSDDGAVLPCALNAACFALLDASVPMVRTFLSMSCALAPDSALLLDPTSAEEGKAQALLCFTLEGEPRRLPDAKNGGDESAPPNVITSWTSGGFASEDFAEALEVCRAALPVLQEFARDSVDKYLNRSDQA